MTSKSMEEEAYLNSLPSGFRFKPTDVELLDYYLKRKVYNKPLPPSKIRAVQLYDNDPETLTAVNNNKSSNGAVDEWYFFTPRERKYKNGKRPGRAAGDGYWKASGADKEIKNNEKVIGSKKSLVFYKGKPPNGDKTNWIMHEFVLSNPPIRKKNGDDDMRLDDWVLCRLYKKQNAKSKPGTLQLGNDEEQEEAADANVLDQTEPHIQEHHGIPPPQSEQFQATDFNVVAQETFPMRSYNAYNDSANGVLPQSPGCYNAYDDSASGGLPQSPGYYNAYDDSASLGLPQFPGCYNAYGSASGGLHQFPECYYDRRLEHGSTIIPGQAVSDYSNFIPTVARISLILPAPTSSMPPDQFHRIPQQQQQQQFPSIANNFLFSPADQFLLGIGLPKK